MTDLFSFIGGDIGPVGLLIWAVLAALLARPGRGRWLGLLLWFIATPGPGILAWQAVDQATVSSIDKRGLSEEKES